MSTHVEFLILGFGPGAVFAALALGLVVVFKSTGVINFAQGAMAMWGAYVFDELTKSGELVLPIGQVPIGTSSLVALALGVVSSAFVGIGAHVLVFRPLRAAPTLGKVVASVGVMLTMQALVVLRFGAEPRQVRRLIPNEVVSWQGISVGRSVLYLAAIAGLLAAAFGWCFRYTRWGLATRAASENEAAVALSGYSTDLLAAAAWVAATAITGLMVILAAPSTTLNPNNYTLLVVPALAVALLGRLRSLGLAWVAGLAMGAAQTEVSLLSLRSWWPAWATVGMTEVIPLLGVIVALFALGNDLPTRDEDSRRHLPAVLWPSQRQTVLVALAGLFLVVTTSGSIRFAVVTSMIAAMIALSLVVLTGLLGQISLAQAAFAGAAGFALSRLGEHVALGFPVTMLAAAGVSSVLGVAVGLPALRIRGAQLAVVTLAAAVAVERLLFRNPAFSPAGGNVIPDPSILGINLAVREGRELSRLPFALMVLVVLVALLAAVTNLMRSDIGKAFLAVRSNESAAAAIGLNVPAVKLGGFAISSFVAGIGGALVGYSRGQLSADSFTVFAGISLLAFAYLGGITSIAGALIAGLFAPLGVIYVLTDRYFDVGRYYQLSAGIALAAAAISYPAGIAGKAHEAAERLRSRHRSSRNDRIARGAHRAS